MKKKIIVCIIASAMICGTFASCGKDKPSDSKSDTKTTTAATTTVTEAAETETTAAETTEAVTTTEAAETTTAANNNDNDAAQEHLTDASAILNNLNDIDRILGGSVDTDADDKKEEGTIAYEKVTESRFTKVDDVKKYVTDNICGTLLDRYSSLYEGNAPYFKDYDGTLYFNCVPRGGGFSFTDEPVITDVTDEAFTITVKFDNFGGDSELVVKAVKDNGLWKASSFTVDGGAENAR